jgi:hypothetical protein
MRHCDYEGDEDDDSVICCLREQAELESMSMDLDEE